MLQHILCLVTMQKSAGVQGKIIMYECDGTFHTHWTQATNQQEETEIVYSGENLAMAWEAAESVRFAKGKEGYTFINPWLIAALHALPVTYVLHRKMECYSDQYFHAELFQELRKWRKEAAKKWNVPPYYVATDKLLYMLSTFIPQQSDELLQIPGIGQAKLDYYGESLLEITQQYDRNVEFPLTWVEHHVSDQQLITWLLDQRFLKTNKKQTHKNQHQEIKDRLVEAVLKKIPLKEIIGQLQLSSTQLMRQFRLLAQEGHDIVSYLEIQMERMEDKDIIMEIIATNGSNRLKPIFEKLYGEGTNLSDKEKGSKYDGIRLIRTYLDLKQAV